MTVLYADWLVFSEARLAEEFLGLFPQCRFLNRFQRGQQRYHELEAKLGARLAGGGFDLSRFPEGQRRAIVERYRDWDQQLAALADQLAESPAGRGATGDLDAFVRTRTGLVLSLTCSGSEKSLRGQLKTLGGVNSLILKSAVGGQPNSLQEWHLEIPQLCHAGPTSPGRLGGHQLRRC